MNAAAMRAGRTWSRRAAVLSFAVFAAFGWAPRGLAVSPSARASASREARSRLEREGRAVVFVSLRLDERAPEGPGLRPSGSSASGRRAIAEAEASLASSLRAIGGSTVRYHLASVPCLVVEAREKAVFDYLDSLDAVDAVELDAEGRGALTESIPYIRADEAQALGYDGTGTTVAVLDSGIAVSHPAFAGAVVHEYHFLGQGADVGPGAADDHGHGTNVAGIVASRGVGAPGGVAPGANIVAIKVLDSDNVGWLADWAAGVDWAIQLGEREDPIRVDVINMSLVSRATFVGPCDDQVATFSRVCRAAEERGIAIFASSGNEGLLDSMTIPACYTSVVSVGSVPDALPRRVSSFTNRSAILDILAPGERITSAGMSGGTSTFSGTSQASPHAAGVACLLKEIDPSASPARIRGLLAATGVRVLDPSTDLSFPIIDARAALEAALVPEIADLRCGAAGRRLDASWSALSGVASYRLSVRFGDEVLVETELQGGESRFEWISPSDGLYEVAVTPLDAGGLRGLEARCSAWVASEKPFVRSECSGDRKLDLSDAVFGLQYLFLGGATPSCLEACDSNDDGGLDIADSVYTLQFLFTGGPPPPAPFGACGYDEAGYALGCASYPCS
ncbi:MAG: S8 family serine peptidase [Planctomycetota bacterium]